MIAASLNLGDFESWAGDRDRLVGEFTELRIFRGLAQGEFR